MEPVIYLIIGLIVGYAGGVRMGLRTKIAKAPTQDKVAANNATNEQRALEHQAQLEKILSSFGADEEITNDKVQALLGVSDTTTGRYLEELEQQGKIHQVGDTGRGVIYKKT